MTPVQNASDPVGVQRVLEYLNARRRAARLDAECDGLKHAESVAHVVVLLGGEGPSGLALTRLRPSLWGEAL